MQYQLQLLQSCSCMLHTDLHVYVQLNIPHLCIIEQRQWWRVNEMKPDPLFLVLCSFYHACICIEQNYLAYFLHWIFGDISFTILHMTKFLNTIWYDNLMTDMRLDTCMSFDQKCFLDLFRFLIVNTNLHQEKTMNTL